LVVCEIQQQSDITYRLYDYGRPRELHLDRGVEVADPGPYAGKEKPRLLRAGVWRLAEGRHFVTDLLEVNEPFGQPCDPRRCLFLICLEGRGSIGTRHYEAGGVWMLPRGEGALRIAPDTPSRLIRTFAPQQAG
jgi:mannose-6-phosphate isomerase